MFALIPKAIQQRLWKHQIEALDFAIRHLNSLESSCLIRMPTGTGKTGVIACLSAIANPGSTLVLTPWAHLRRQMIEDIQDRFWKKRGIRSPTIKVEDFFPSSAARLLHSADRKVLVGTFTTLNDLRLDYEPVYKQLATSVSLILVDEGHYEPAVEWGKSVKGLGVKTVLLTATPYRNDLKLFRITDPRRSAHHFQHKDAVKDGIIRSLKHERLAAAPDIASLSTAFAKEWKALKRTDTLPSGSPRAIICCSTAADIEQVVASLRHDHIDALGVHEQFENSTNPSLRKDVPDTHQTIADVWVHQNKLTEGLDDDRFCLIALFTRIRNDRKLIQQFGRILRRGPSDRLAPAIVLAPDQYSAAVEWEAYLAFESELRLLDPQHFRDAVDMLLGTQPEVEYFDGRFRRRFQPSDLATRAQVIVPPSVLVRNQGAAFTLDGYVEDCTDTLNTADGVILGPNANGPCQKGPNFALWVYASVRNARFLNDTSLYEIKLETHCVVTAHGFVFMSDSAGHFPVEYLEEHTGLVSPDELKRFLDKSFRLTNVSTDSSIPYDAALRGADLRAHDLLRVPASLTDRVQICRSARGTSKKYGRRYVGLTTGRLRKEVSEVDRRNFDLTAFIAWAEEVARLLRSRAASSDVFRRYMPTCAPPPNPIPETISLDLARLDVTLQLANGTECGLKSSSSTVQVIVAGSSISYECGFEIEGDGVPAGSSIVLSVQYDAPKRRFWFKRGRGVSLRVSVDGESTDKGLAEFLNQRQDIVLIGLQGGEIVYQGRNFFAIDYSYAEQVLVDLIHQPAATACSTEKGTPAQIDSAKRTRATTFPARSLFRAIANRDINLPFKDELLICDDLGSECADFVAANFGTRQLALLHAKAGHGSKISASAFHDVTAQAMKNLVYLTMNGEVPKGISSWRRDGKWNSTGVPRMYRAAAGVPSGKKLWRKLKEDIIGTSNPALYVILVTTGCCDLRELKRAISGASRRTPEVAQLLYLLDGLNSYARQLGARLMVLDIPYRP